MKVIVGLGNPGKEYEETRHNVGFMALDELALKLQATSYRLQAKFNAEMYRVGEILLVKPQSFMNRSGEAVRKIVDFYKIPVTGNQLPEDSRLWVVHDDLDIKLGEYKIQLGIGPKVHNGVTSVEQAMGTKAFWRVRVGIDNRVTSDKLQVTGEEYVLMPFLVEEKPIIETVLGKAVDELYERIVQASI